MPDLLQPNEIPKKDKTNAAASYFMMFASFAIGLPFPFINLIVSIIYYYASRNKSKFVKFHALQSVLSQIPITILNTLSLVWVVYNIIDDFNFHESFFLAMLIVFVLNIVYLVLSIIAATHANDGKLYYFVMVGEIAYNKTYGNNIDDKDEEDYMNQPPPDYIQ